MAALPKPLPVIAGAYKVRVFGQHAGLPFGNDLCFAQLGDLTTPPTALQVATLVASKWPALATAALHSEYVGVSVGVYDLTTAGSALVTVPLTAAGGITGSVLPTGIAALVRNNVNVRGKVGHTYLGPIASQFTTSTDADHLVPASRAAIQSAWDAFITAIETDSIWGTLGGDFSVLSYQTNKISNPRALHVVSSAVETPLASQNRRRLR
jgi:hypothetical protein